MSGFHNAIVWIDPSEAKVFRFSDEDKPEVDVRPHALLQRLHHRSAGWEVGGNPPEDTEFFQRIMGRLDPIGDIVVSGPGYAKVKFKAFLDHFRPAVAVRVRALEDLEHPGAEALLAIGRRYFSGRGRASLYQERARAARGRAPIGV